jgi:predicted aspartyl protease
VKQIGVPTTEVIGETAVNGSKKPLHILIDTGISSYIILKKFISKSLLVKNSRTTAEWTTSGGKFYTKKQGTVKFKLPEFFLNKTIEFKVHVDETTVHANATYDMIKGRDLNSELKLVLDFDTQCITWDGIDKPMKTQGGIQKETTHYEDLYSALMAPVGTVSQDDYDAACKPQHVHAANKRQTRILCANYKAADLQEFIKYISTTDDIEKK